VILVSASSPYLTAELSESKHKERPGYIVTATVKPNTPLDNIKGEITIQSNDLDQPEVKVLVYAYVEEK